MTNELLFDAIGEIDDGFILDVAEILTQSGGKVVRPRNKTVPSPSSEAATVWHASTSSAWPTV